MTDYTFNRKYPVILTTSDSTPFASHQENMNNLWGKIGTIWWLIRKDAASRQADDDKIVKMN